LNFLTYLGSFLSDNKDKPLNADELSEVSDIITDADSDGISDDALNLESSGSTLTDAEILATMDVDDASHDDIKHDSVIAEEAQTETKNTLFFAAYVLQQDDLVRSQFEGKRWALPARVFARPLELYEGQNLHWYRAVYQKEEFIFYPNTWIQICRGSRNISSYSH